MIVSVPDNRIQSFSSCLAFSSQTKFVSFLKNILKVANLVWNVFLFDIFIIFREEGREGAF